MAMDVPSFVVVPQGWQREVEGDTVYYISPDLYKLRNTEEVSRHLTSPGTCKCGISCPLRVEEQFSFDANILSLPDHVSDQQFTTCKVAGMCKFSELPDQSTDLQKRVIIGAKRPLPVDITTGLEPSKKLQVSLGEVLLQTHGQEQTIHKEENPVTTAALSRFSQILIQASQSPQSRGHPRKEASSRDLSSLMWLADVGKLLGERLNQGRTRKKPIIVPKQVFAGGKRPVRHIARKPASVPVSPEASFPVLSARSASDPPETHGELTMKESYVSDGVVLFTGDCSAAMEVCTEQVPPSLSSSLPYKCDSDQVVVVSSQAPNESFKKADTISTDKDAMAITHSPSKCSYEAESVGPVYVSSTVCRTQTSESLSLVNSEKKHQDSEQLNATSSVSVNQNLCSQPGYSQSDAESETLTQSPNPAHHVDPPSIKPVPPVVKSPLCSPSKIVLKELEVKMSTKLSVTPPKFRRSPSKDIPMRQFHIPLTVCSASPPQQSVSNRELRLLARRKVKEGKESKRQHRSTSFDSLSTLKELESPKKKVKLESISPVSTRHSTPESHIASPSDSVKDILLPSDTVSDTSSSDITTSSLLSSGSTANALQSSNSPTSNLSSRPTTHAPCSTANTPISFTSTASDQTSSTSIANGSHQSDSNANTLQYSNSTANTTLSFSSSFSSSTASVSDSFANIPPIQCAPRVTPLYDLALTTSQVCSDTDITPSHCTTAMVAPLPATSTPSLPSVMPSVADSTGVPTESSLQSTSDSTIDSITTTCVDTNVPPASDSSTNETTSVSDTITSQTVTESAGSDLKCATTATLSSTSPYNANSATSPSTDSNAQHIDTMIRVPSSDVAVPPSDTLGINGAATTNSVLEQQEKKNDIPVQSGADTVEAQSFIAIPENAIASGETTGNEYQPPLKSAETPVLCDQVGPSIATEMESPQVDKLHADNSETVEEDSRVCSETKHNNVQELLSNDENAQDSECGDLKSLGNCDLQEDQPAVTKVEESGDVREYASSSEGLVVGEEKELAHDNEDQSSTSAIITVSAQDHPDSVAGSSTNLSSPTVSSCDLNSSFGGHSLADSEHSSSKTDKLPEGDSMNLVTKFDAGPKFQSNTSLKKSVDSILQQIDQQKCLAYKPESAVSCTSATRRIQTRSRSHSESSSRSERSSRSISVDATLIAESSSVEGPNTPSSTEQHFDLTVSLPVSSTKHRHTILPCKSPTYSVEIGDIVWAKAHLLPGWPGKIISDSERVEGELLEAPHGKAWVEWIGDSTVSLVDVDTIKPLKDGIKNRTKNKNKLPKQLQQSINKALKLLGKRNKEKRKNECPP